MSKNAKARRGFERRRKKPASRGLIWGVVAAAVVFVAVATVIVRKKAKK